jgi:hypothetical protein
MNTLPVMITRTLASHQPHPLKPSADISRGATEFGLRAQVLLEEEMRDAYAEMDPALGQNVIGSVLAVLACHLAMGEGGRSEDRISVCLLRRSDDRLVEVDLAIHRHRRAGRECLSLRGVAEREIAD